MEDTRPAQAPEMADGPKVGMIGGAEEPRR